MNPNEEVQEKPATPQTEESVIFPIAEIASEEQWNHQVAILNRKSSDLVNSDVVQQGYMVHGHPASMGFIHLNKMTTSRTILSAHTEKIQKKQKADITM